jgi:phosphomannomutase
MRAIPTLKISISGVRGVVGDSLTPRLVTRFAQAFGTYVGSGRIVIGRDTRTSGEMVRQAVVAGLVSSGCRVVDLGVCPTPTVQLLVRQIAAQGGIAITASHNPPEWNALKFVGGDGLFLGAERGRELLDLYHGGDYAKVSTARLREVRSLDDALDRHVAAVVGGLGPLPESGRRLTAVVDSCNGAGSLVTPRLLEAFGVTVHAIHVTPDGRFPRTAEPTPEALQALSDAVRAHGADVGFAQDMDADRLAVVAETGEPIGEERTLVLALEQVLVREPGTLVANISTTHALEAMAARHGCAVRRSAVGEANVTAAMRQHRAVAGGEGNGGVIYPRINFARDSLVGIGLILRRLADTGRPISALADALGPYHVVKLQRPCPTDRARRILRRAREAYAPAELLDGVKVRRPEGWFLLRGSNTEPILRVVAEAASPEAARRLAESVLAEIEAWPS